MLGFVLILVLISIFLIESLKLWGFVIYYCTSTTASTAVPVSTAGPRKNRQDQQGSSTSDQQHQQQNIIGTIGREWRLEPLY